MTTTNDLVERYIHHVGRYLPPKERADIQTELRSQIQDQLDDRYGPTPSREEVAAALTALGEPRRIAASYTREQYLIGPDLYPVLMLVLRYVWLLVPSVVVFLEVFAVLSGDQPVTFNTLVLDPLFAAVPAVLSFSALVILIFAIWQRAGTAAAVEHPFDPTDLPEVDDPAAVDRFEAAFGIALGIVVTVLLLYFLRVGGLTLQFSASNPADVIPVPPVWLLLLIITLTANIVVNLLALRHNRWTFGSWLLETVLEVFGAICLYFAVFLPLFDHLAASTTEPNLIPLLTAAPELITIISALGILLPRGMTLVRLWGDQQRDPRSLTAPTSR